MPTEQEIMFNNRRKEAVAIALEEAKDKKAIDDANRLRLTVRHAYYSTKNYVASDPQKMTRRKLMAQHNITLEQINSIIG